MCGYNDNNAFTRKAGAVSVAMYVEKSDSKNENFPLIFISTKVSPMLEKHPEQYQILEFFFAVHGAFQNDST